jgi:hypothetical protein
MLEYNMLCFSYIDRVRRLVTISEDRELEIGWRDDVKGKGDQR